jgi:hypothetical protein
MIDEFVILLTQVIEEGGAKQIASMFVGSFLVDLILVACYILLAITQTRK